MADQFSRQRLDSISDGPLRRGLARREQILQAALRVIERGGIGGVSQRSVATEAGVTPTLVVYHFETVANMLSESLIMSHERYIRDARSSIEWSGGPLEASADMVAAPSDDNRHRAVAKFELLLQAAHNARIQAILAEWRQAVDDLIRPCG